MIWTRGAKLKSYWLRELSFLRTRAWVTQVLGYEYSVSQDLIEIDITYACNLTCNNCNRSSAQAPSREHIDLNQIDAFLNQSAAQGRRWRRIRLLGGEPTLHPQFLEIVNRIRQYRDSHSRATLIEIATNGHGAKVQSVLAKLPSDIAIVDTQKANKLQPAFATFNVAPRDLPEYRDADYRNGCKILSDCGMGLTPRGFYPCAIAGGIDRILGEQNGRTELPPRQDGMRDLLQKHCELCGHFKRRADPPLLSQKSSITWTELYRTYRGKLRKS
jgi:hypothetical protein